MIVYDKLWKTMKERGITQYKLIHEYGISTGNSTDSAKTERSAPLRSTRCAGCSVAESRILSNTFPTKGKTESKSAAKTHMPRFPFI